MVEVRRCILTLCIIAPTMSSNEGEILKESLTNMQRLRRWRESVGLEHFASVMLEAFRASESAEERETIWDGFLENLSQTEENLSEQAFSDWTNELLRALSNHDPEKRLQALTALRDMAKHLKGREAVISGLVRCLYDNSKAVRDQAVYTTEWFADVLLVKALANSFSDHISRGPASDDPDKTTIWHAAFALDLVIDGLGLSDFERDDIAEKLLQTLLRVVSGPDASSLDIWKIGDSIGEHIKGKRALAILTEMFAHSNPVVRDSAIHGLGHLRGSEAMALITLALSDPDAEVREEAQNARAHIESGAD